ncbi:MAG: NUDIX domain-containing protein [Dehalococcoidia bacterium]|nr:NUDIX domain-containing protein [Dehalococcoidia bacterium]
MPGQSPHDPIDRPTSRVLLLDEQGRALLFTVEEPDQDTGKRFWFPPGGGVEPGETHEEAARRELLEETGIEHPPGPCIWIRDPILHYFKPHNAWYRTSEQYYVVQVAKPEVTTDRWTELEIHVISRFQWWSLEEMLSSDDLFVPRRLAELLPPILRGEIPQEPLAIGV